MTEKLAKDATGSDITLFPIIHRRGTANWSLFTLNGCQAAVDINRFMNQKTGAAQQRD
jgi:hypothetical protein